jgi:hypothetical protein
MRLILVVVFSLASVSARAATFGTTYGVGRTAITDTALVPIAVTETAPGAFPSFDLVLGGMYLQLFPLDFGFAIFENTLLLSANLFLPPAYSAQNGAATIAPGVSVEISSNSDTDVSILSGQLLARIGVSTGDQGMRAGIYIVPGAGVAVIEGDVEIMASGSLELSLWMP